MSSPIHLQMMPEVTHLLQTLADIATESDLPVLLIGGHAVTALGCPRSTFDIDLLIPRQSAPDWEAVLAKLQYRTFHRSEQFLQMEGTDELPLPPIDFMLVDEEVFEQLHESRFSAQPLATPGVLPLIALKLHAIRQPTRDNIEKDWQDIFSLIRAHGLTLDNSDLRAIVLRHGGERAIERIQTELG
ncbi:hypothetical protein [Roseibacillus ishigakijimensis]|uniref:Nucleotidyltransferase family protein n=1 Tax=Roseibacillus ishigakijimensis TaxID=454146 RepID=A0A934VIU6_9BACT|nr:hypothetical protein [Roseibacillus ishigakijimensis]MBK1835443.1 hypothetical protein [Roseibacillus ishigakijimensis]